MSLLSTYINPNLSGLATTDNVAAARAAIDALVDADKQAVIDAISSLSAANLTALLGAIAAIPAPDLAAALAAFDSAKASDVNGAKSALLEAIADLPTTDVAAALAAYDVARVADVTTARSAIVSAIDALPNDGFKPGMFMFLKGTQPVPAGWTEQPGRLGNSFQSAAAYDSVLTLEPPSGGAFNDTSYMSSGRDVVSIAPAASTVVMYGTNGAFATTYGAPVNYTFNGNTTVNASATALMAATWLDSTTILLVWFGRETSDISSTPLFIAQRYTWSDADGTASKTHEMTLACGEYEPPFATADKFQCLAPVDAGKGVLRLFSNLESRPKGWLLVDFADATMSVAAGQSATSSSYITSNMATRADGVTLFRSPRRVQANGNEGYGIQSVIRVRGLYLGTDGTIKSRFSSPPPPLAPVPWKAVSNYDTGLNALCFAFVDDDDETFILTDRTGFYAYTVDGTTGVGQTRQVAGLHPLMESSLFDGFGAPLDFTAVLKDRYDNGTQSISMFTRATPDANTLQFLIDFLELKAGFGRLISKD